MLEVMLPQPKSLQETIKSTPGLSEPGSWHVIHIDTYMGWPLEAQSFDFEGKEIWVIPVANDALPGLAVRNGGEDREAVFACLYRALSLLSWLNNSGATVTSRSTGNRYFPMHVAENPRVSSRLHTFDLTSLPIIESDEAKLALALLREGRGLNHPAYSFLSFYRVLERAFPDGKARGKWMTDAVARMEGHRPKEALAKLIENFDGDVGTHLRESGRGAVAHAIKRPVANPDNPSDYQRLSRERPIIEELAVMAIEEVFGIKTSHTLWREHLYELQGWKPRFGPDLIAVIIQGGEPPAGTLVDLPKINVRLRESEPFPPLEGLQPQGWAVSDNKAEVQYASDDGLVSVVLLLDFPNERLVLPEDLGIAFYDDGSVKAARVAKALTEFNHDYFGNGELQVWNAEDGSLMSKCGAFIPVNVMFNPEGARAELEALDAEIVRRLMKPQGPVGLRAD